MRLRVAALLFLFAALPVEAAGEQFGYRFSVSPRPALGTDPLIVTIEAFTTQCAPLPSLMGLEDLGGGVIRIRLNGTDACESVPPETRSYNVGSLAPGSYVFRFAACGINLPPGVPGDGCATLADVPVLVQGLSAARFTVPLLSQAAVLALASAVLLLGFSAFRRD